MNVWHGVRYDEKVGRKEKKKEKEKKNLGEQSSAEYQQRL